MHSTPATTTTVATVAPLANTPAKATVRTRRANSALAKANTGSVAVAKHSKAPKATPATPKARAANFVPVPLVVNPKRVAAALAQYKAGAKPARAAGVLGCTVGQYAMLCMLGGTTPLGGNVPNHAYGSKAPGAPATPLALAKYVGGARAAGRSWGWLAAATRTTEGTVRAAYQCHTGQHHSTTGVGAWAHRNAR